MIKARTECVKIASNLSPDLIGIFQVSEIILNYIETGIVPKISSNEGLNIKIQEVK